MNVSENLEAQTTLSLAAGETAHIVMASTSEVFEMLGDVYQKFSYELKITKEELYLE